MSKIIKNTILNYIPDNLPLELNINPLRIYHFNNKKIKKGYIVYLCERELRLNYNPALNFAIEVSKKLNLTIKIIHPYIKYDYYKKQEFIDNLVFKTKKHFTNSGFIFEFCFDDNILKYLNAMDIALLIIDFNPILNRQYLKEANFKILEIDGHNIIPARYVSNKQEYNAATLRRKIYNKIYGFLNIFEKISNIKTEAENILDYFIENKLPYYSKYKNNPSSNMTSNLSAYLNLGFISSQYCAYKILKSNVENENKEFFLEELIIRKELADNFCLYCKNYKNLDCIPNWAKKSLNKHKDDLRNYMYSLSEFENAKTHNKLWNATQIQLLKEGRIHGYLRMYWAKKILEWSPTPQDALKYAIYLNDKYSFDSPSTSGYCGIMWALGALHDRAFQDWHVTGKIRRMTFKSIKRKYKDIDKYIDKYS